MTNFHVSIVGAGLGGLCLAQALKGAQVAFDVFERDPAVDSRLQGYRIRIDADGQRDLAKCLPTDLYRLFRDSASVASSAARFLTPQLMPASVQAPESWKLDAIEEAAGTADLCVHRQTFREILLSGLEPHVHFGHVYAGFSAAEDGRIVVAFEDRTSVTSTVLVGADGVNSRVRRQLVSASEPWDTESLCIFGKSQILDGPLGHGTTVIVDNGSAAIVDPIRFRKSLPELAARIAPECNLTAVSDYLYWAVIAPRGRFGLEGAGHDFGRADNLGRAPASAIRGWHPQLQRMVAGSEQADLAMLPVRRGHPDITWLSGPVTLLGDAVHVMSPAGGLGANTALKDARVLAQAIADAARGTQSLATAIAWYEADMRERAKRALAASERGAAILFSTSHTDTA